MRVFVRAPTGETSVLCVDADHTVARLKDQCGFGDFAVTYGGLSLDDSEQLGEYGLSDGSTLHLVPTLAGGGDGTPAMGKRHKKTHGLCIRRVKNGFREGGTPPARKKGSKSE